MAKNFTKEEIAKIIQGIRIKAGMTQQQAADAIGRRRQTLASWETGQSQPDANTLFVLFRLYNADLNEAFGFSTKKVDLNRREQAVISAYRNNPGLQIAVDRILEIDVDISREIAPPVERADESTRPARHIAGINDEDFEEWSKGMTREEYGAYHMKRYDARKNVLASFSTSERAGT